MSEQDETVYLYARRLLAVFRRETIERVAYVPCFWCQLFQPVGEERRVISWMDWSSQNYEVVKIKTLLVSIYLQRGTFKSILFTKRLSFQEP